VKSSGGEPERRGEIALPPASDQAGRLAAACRIAGALAECGVQRIELAEPRACRVLALEARTSDLPGQIVRAEPGTVLAASGVALWIESDRVSWAASGGLAEALSRV